MTRHCPDCLLYIYYRISIPVITARRSSVGPLYRSPRPLRGWQPFSPFSISPSYRFPGFIPCRHRFGFIRCKGLLSRLIRQLEVYFLQILPPRVERNWQEKPSYKAVPTAVCRIHKTPKRFRQKKNRTKGKKKTI